MTGALVPFNLDDHRLATAHEIARRFRHDPGVREIEKYGARQAAIMAIQVEKTIAALNHQDDIYRHLARTGDQFIRDAHRRLEANHRSSECQADYEVFHGEVLTSYVGDVVATARVGARNIAQIVHDEIPMPVDDTRGVLRKVWDDLFSP